MCLKTGQKPLSDLRKGGSERCSTGDLLQGWERTTAFVLFVNIFVTTVIIQIFKKYSRRTFECWFKTGPKKTLIDGGKKE
tara:strand:- start:318 stop:557 length:240 start_codon:yes stop_codon:yes gene_type:complete